MRFTNVLGTFDEHGNPAQGEGADMPHATVRTLLQRFHDSTHRQRFREANLELTARDLRGSVGPDWLAIQAITTIEELDRICNGMVARLREWYELHNPELSRSVADNERFTELVSGATEGKESTSIGAQLELTDIDAMRELARHITALYASRKATEGYLEQLMKRSMPNLQAVAGTLVGAKLLHQAASLKHLMMLPSTTVQLLGAEKALFRHLRTGAKPPKYGILFQHPVVQHARQQGKAARLVADKISIAAKVDYFKGVFVGDKLNEEIQRKLR